MPDSTWDSHGPGVTLNAVCAFQTLAAEASRLKDSFARRLVFADKQQVIALARGKITEVMYSKGYLLGQFLGPVVPEFSGHLQAV